MLHIEGAVDVEGRYEKARVARLVDCPVIVTNGFGIFKDKKMADIKRNYARNGKIIILTDSDSAGFRIRAKIKGLVSDGKVENAYIPDSFGKESRKNSFSAEGKLCVEGVKDEYILKALAPFASGKDSEGSKKITLCDLYNDGLTGYPGANGRRAYILKRLGLPERLPAKSLLQALNASVDYNEYKSLIKETDDKGL